MVYLSRTPGIWTEAWKESSDYKSVAWSSAEKRLHLWILISKKMSRIYFKKIFSENYTWILTTARELIPVMAKSFQVCEEQIRVWGQPRNDLIFFPPDRKKNSRGNLSSVTQLSEGDSLCTYLS